MKNKILILLLSISIHAFAQLEIGDPGVTFDATKFDNRYPQINEWITAGVRGGIPFIEDLNIRTILNDGATSNDINTAITNLGNTGGTILLKNGNYRIDQQVNLKSNVRILGESRTGVVCTIYLENASGFLFGSGVKNAGLYRLTIQGSWGKPQYDWNYSLNANNELPNNDNISVKFREATDCWLDQVTILNSAQDPLRCNAKHITLRNLIVDGVHKKAGGAQGYFFIQDSHNLITGCQITHLRHISLQGSKVEYNVVINNDFRQEVSFHSSDKGYNLIENNRIILPSDMPPVADIGNNKPVYFAVMGPWSSQHQNSARPNYLLNNDCVQNNHDHGSRTPWSAPNIVYKGPKKIAISIQDRIDNFPAETAVMTPIGNTFYPIELENTDDKNLVNLTPIDDAYLSGNSENNFNTADLRVETNNRYAYLKFDIQNINKNIEEAKLKLTVGADAGSGKINIYQVNSNWEEQSIDGSNKPNKISNTNITSMTSSYVIGETYTFDVTLADFSNDNISFILEMENGNDVSFASKENNSFAKPKLEVKSNATLSIHKHQTNHDISIAPNPVTDFATIQGLKSNTQWVLTDTSARIIKRGSTAKVDFTNLNSGLYILKLSNGLIFKIIK